MTIKYLPAILLVGLILPFSAIAQSEPSQMETVASVGSEKGSILGSCFDYYRFGSVPITIISRTTQVAQGGELKLTVSIHNENTYPVNNVAVFTKVFYKKNFDKSSFGPDVIDFMKVADHLYLAAGEQKTIEYVYRIPAHADTGTYQIAGYVNEADRYNLAGLTFTNDIVGSLFNYTVVGDTFGAVRFDNTRTVVNGVGYHAAIFSPLTQYEKNGLPITSVVANTTNADFVGTVHWSVYSWDALNPNNLITENDQKVVVRGHASTTLSYVVTDKKHSVYYVVGRLYERNSNVTQSIITVRYIQNDEGIEPAPRIAFLGASTFPAQKDTTKAFVCVHSSGNTVAKHASIVLKVVPRDPLVWLLSLGSLGSKEYSGSIPGEVSLLSVPFSHDSQDYTVTATLYQNGQLVDTVSSTYLCSDAGKKCSHQNYWVLIVLGVVGTIGTLYVLRRRKQVTTNG